MVKRGTISACTREGKERKERKRLKSILSSLGKRKEEGGGEPGLTWLALSINVSYSPFFCSTHRPRDLGKEKEEEGILFAASFLFFCGDLNAEGDVGYSLLPLKWNPRLLTPVVIFLKFVCCRKLFFKSIGKCRNNSRVKNTASSLFPTLFRPKKSVAFLLLLHVDDCAFSSCA